VWTTYAEAAADRAVIASGLEALGVKPRSRVGLYSINCADWVLTEAALTRMACVSVPLYDTLGPDAVRYICNHAELGAVACSAAVLPTMLGQLREVPSVKLVVVFNIKPGMPPPLTGQAANVPGVTVRCLMLAIPVKQSSDSTAMRVAIAGGHPGRGPRRRSGVPCGASPDARHGCGHHLLHLWCGWISSLIES